MTDGRAQLPSAASASPYRSLAELEAHAVERVDPGTWAYVSDVAEDGRTARRERSVLEQITLRQRGLGETGPIETAISLLGQDLALPVLAAPTSGQAFVHPGAERAMVEGCADAGTIAVVPMSGSATIEQIGAVERSWWLQLYLPSDPGVVDEIASRAAEAGATGMVVSVDVPIVARRRNVPAGYPPGWNERLRGLRGGADEGLSMRTNRPFRWSGLAPLAGRAGLPLLVKGILDPDDARRAVDHGVDGLVVSTHGGRQLDRAPTAAEVLPSVVAAVGGRCRVLADGGIRRGSDALCLLVRGADAVLIGRPALWGLACAGAAGVTDVFAVLRQELTVALGLTGCRSLADVSPEMEWRPTVS